MYEALRPHTLRVLVMHEKRAILTRELAGSTQPDQAPAAGRGEGAEGIGKFEFWKVSVFFLPFFLYLKKTTYGISITEILYMWCFVFLWGGIRLRSRVRQHQGVDKKSTTAPGLLT